MRSAAKSRQESWPHPGANAFFRALQSHSVARSSAIVALLLIVAFAAYLRFSNQTWDGGYQLHPDERGILYVAQDISFPSSAKAFFDASTSPLNPYRNRDGSERMYVYGSVPLYAMVLVQHLAARPCSHTSLCTQLPADTFTGRLLNVAELPNLDHLTYIGRALSALLDTSTVAATCLLALVLSRRTRAGLLAAVLVAANVLHIQNAHFATSDSYLAFFSVSTILCLCHYSMTASPWSSYLAGGAAGAAIGSKMFGIVLVVPILFVHTCHFRCSVQTTPGLSLKLGRGKVLWITLLIMGGILFVTNPYLFLDPQAALSALSDQFLVTIGFVHPPFMLQYVGSSPADIIDQQVRWTLGPLLAAVGYSGLVWGFVVSIRGKNQHLMLAAGWVMIQLVLAAIWQAKFPRYLLPATPVLIALGVVALTSPSAPWYLMRNVVIIATATLSIAGAIAFKNMYRTPHPWVLASSWIYQNIPAQSVLISETGDDTLPLDLTGRDGEHIRELTYRSRQISLLAQPDDLDKAKAIAEALSSVDYVIISSDQSYSVALRQSARYPVTSRFYRLLFGEELGYRLASAWSRYPNLFGLAVVDDTFFLSPRIRTLTSPSASVLDIGVADESFTVYDHPLVLLFHNSAHMSSWQMQRLILGSAPSGTN